MCNQKKKKTPNFLLNRNHSKTLKILTCLFQGSHAGKLLCSQKRSPCLHPLILIAVMTKSSMKQCFAVAFQIAPDKLQVSSTVFTVLTMKPSCLSNVPFNSYIFSSIPHLLSVQYLQDTFQLLHLFICTVPTIWTEFLHRRGKIANNLKDSEKNSLKNVLGGFRVCCWVLVLFFFLWVYALLSFYMPFPLPQDNDSNPFLLPQDNSLCKIGQYAGVTASHRWKPTSPYVHWWASRLLSKRPHHCQVCLFLPQL